MRKLMTAAAIGAVLCVPIYAAPDPTPEPTVIKAKVAHILTVQVTGMT